MKYVYVHCSTTGRDLWIDQKYVQLYPHLYKVILYKGKPMKADVVTR